MEPGVIDGCALYWKMVPLEQMKPSSIQVLGFCCARVPMFPSVHVKTQQRLDIEGLKVLSQRSPSPGEVLMHTKAPRPCEMNPT